MKPVPAWRDYGVAALKVLGRSIARLFTPETSLAVGGICYYGLLALAPMLMLTAVLYGFIFEPETAAVHLAILSESAPGPAQAFIADQLARMASASHAMLSWQGAIALLIALYAASRGTKSVVLGLTVMRGESHAWGFVGYNLLGVGFAVAAVAAFVLAGASAAAGPMGAADMPMRSYLGRFVLEHRWFVSGSVFAVGAGLLYRFVMAEGYVPWRWCAVGGVAAGVLWASGSAAFAGFNRAAIELGEIYGSLAAAVAFLLWLYLTASAVLWGGALASEGEFEMRRWRDAGARSGGRRRCGPRAELD